LRSPPGNPRRSRILEGVALLLLAVSALGFQGSATAPWAEARAGDGRRLQISPIGIADFGLGTSGTAPTECRWWPKLGDEELCAISNDAEREVTWLRRTYPYVVIALWTAVLAIFLNALRIPRVPRAAGVIVAMVLPAFAALAYRGIFMGAPRALRVISGLSLDPVATGFGSIAVAAMCSAVATVLLVLSGRLRRD
jgi:hypothetical protein